MGFGISVSLSLRILSKRCLSDHIFLSGTGLGDGDSALGYISVRGFRVPAPAGQGSIIRQDAAQFLGGRAVFLRDRLTSCIPRVEESG